MTARFVALSILASLATSISSFADIQPGNCARAASYSESKRGFSILVMQNGRTVFEHYANGGSADSRCKIFSGTKSFWGIAALCAVRDGLIKLDDRVADTITEWKADPRRSQITIRQLLNQTDGIEPAPHLHSESIRDRNAAAIQLPLVAAPGSAFAYGPSHLQIFAELLRRKLNGRSTISYLRENVLSPLGLTTLELKWQRAHWIGVCLCRAAPADIVVGLGSNYERLYIIPSLNALIVRQGMSAKFSDAYFLRLVLGR